MTFHHRRITTETLDWHGILIQVTFERQSHADHIQVETLDPQRAPLPITETGYCSSFITKDTITDRHGPADYVIEWLDTACQQKGWWKIEDRVRQFELL